MKWNSVALHTCSAAVLLFVGVQAYQTPRVTDDPLPVARQGYLFAGGIYSTVNGQQVMTGHLYAEYRIPLKQTHPWPIVMIPGACCSGTDFTGTPDGREGWAQFFVRQGYAVYVVDPVGRGRAAYQTAVYGATAGPGIEGVQRFFVATERYKLWPQAHLHTQWPGSGAPGDPFFDQFYASVLPSIADATVTQTLNRDAILALVEKIGPAIMLTHSQSAAFGWLVADVRPDMVKGLIGVEPNGPPFVDISVVGQPNWFRDSATRSRPWGLTAIPLRYAPAVGAASDLEIVREETAAGPDLSRCWLQKSAPRLLPNLGKVPILVLTAEASYHAAYDHCTVRYLDQAGVHPTFVKLADVGIRGNGHMLMLEKNNFEIAGVISTWLETTLR